MVQLAGDFAPTEGYTPYTVTFEYVKKYTRGWGGGKPPELPGDTHTVRAIVFEMDEDYLANSVRDIIELDVTVGNGHHFARYFDYYEPKFASHFADKVGFGRAKKFETKVSKLVDYVINRGLEEIKVEFKEYNESISEREGNSD